MVNKATEREREMRVAVERVVGFAQEFGEAHLNLACHAAFPLSLTPDLLYQIWANFAPEAPWTAVARILLSRLCKQVGSEMYEMDNSVRNLLLRELKVQFRQERFDSLGEFLLEYVKQRLTADDPDTQDLRQAQEWTALAYTKPEQAARELARVLSDKVQQEDIGEVLRLSSLVETLSEPLVEAGFEPLLIYGQGIKSYVFGDLKASQIHFNSILKSKNRVNVAGIRLIIPPILYPTFFQVISGSYVYRIYQNRYNPTEFRYFGGIGRFDHHSEVLDNRQKDEERGIYYVSPIIGSVNDAISNISNSIANFVENSSTIERTQKYNFCILKIIRELKLLDLRGDGAMRAGSTSSICTTSDRTLSQKWSRHFYEHENLYSKVDGIIYLNLHDSYPAIALYERAEDALKLIKNIPLDTPNLSSILQDFVKSLEIIIPSK